MTDEELLEAAASKMWDAAAMRGGPSFAERRQYEAVARAAIEVFRREQGARDEALREAVKYAADQIEARDALAASYRVGRLTKKAERTINAIEADAASKLRALSAAPATEGLMKAFTGMCVRCESGWTRDAHAKECVEATLRALSERSDG
jgi:hypothetical protein